MNVSSLSFSILFGTRDDSNPNFLTRLSVKACILTMGVLGFLGGVNPCSAIAANQEGKPGSEKLMVLRLSLDDAIAMFLHQNLNLLKAKYGIETARAKKITAGLFPNPEFSFETLSAYTQDCQLSNCGAINHVISQLFLVAGKRGFRIESAEFGAQSAEAGFEDTLRQLSFAVKDAYYRVQVVRRHLVVDKQTRDELYRVFKKMTGPSTQVGKEEDRIRIQIQTVEAQEAVIRDIQQIDSDTGDLLQLLALPPETELALTTELTYRRVAPDIIALQRQVEDARPDVRAKRLLYAKRRSELKLALAIRYPDMTVDLGFAIQGSQGPDNQQQWTLNLGMPLPVFDRNQGGIKEAATAVQAAEADLRQTLNEAHSQVDLAHRHLVQSRRLVEAYRSGALSDAESLLNTVEQNYKNGKTTNLYFLDAARTASDIQEDYLDALYNYQRDILLLESAAGQSIS